MVVNERINSDDEPDGRKHETGEEQNSSNKLLSVIRNLQDQIRFKDIYEEAIVRLKIEIRNDPNNSHKIAELANAKLFLEESKINIRALEYQAHLLANQSMADLEAELRQECASVSQQTGIYAQEVISEVK